MIAFLTRHRNGFLLALQFLTIFPVKNLRQYDESDSGMSLLYYPVIGAAIGALLVAVSLMALQIFSALLSAVLIVTIWLLATGLLHIDGLADCADAWVGGFGSRLRTLELMKDPTCGPVAVAVVVMVLLLKVMAVNELLQDSGFYNVVWVPVLARLSVLVLLLTTPYVREGGLGEILLRHFSPGRAVALCVVVVLLLLWNQPYIGGLLVAFLLLSLLFMRQLMVDRLGGCTGDTIGALVELIEVMGLLVLVATLPTN